ncbi:hypothetical protein LMG33810_002848 [Carnimonas sp. LMG 33810]
MPTSKNDWSSVDWALDNHTIAKYLGCTHWTVGKWRHRLGHGKAPSRVRKDKECSRPHSAEWGRKHQHIATAAALNSPRSARGVGNVNATYWWLISPTGTVYFVRNLYDFVRSNPTLFQARDREWKRKGGKRGTGGEYCNATAGIQNIRCGRANSWKGWRLLSD